MKQPTRTTGIAAALALLSGAAVAAANPGETAFRLMSEQEIADHAAAMATLEGAAREDYRNTQYRALRARALEQGYLMPENPPWLEPAASGQDPMAQHQAMRERLQAHREQVAEQAAPAQAPLAEPQATTVSDRTEASAPAPEPAVAHPPAEDVSPATSQLAREDGPAADRPAITRADIATAPPAPAPVAQAPAPVEPAPPAAPTTAITTPSQQAGTDRADTMQQGHTEPTAGVGSEAMNAYRETMRARFDEYMRERQAQFEENIRRHREQREVTLEQQPSRVTPPAPPSPPRMQPYGYPPAPGYGPRYPSGFPGYRTPYWQQNP